MPSKKPQTITVGMLREHLAVYPDHYEVDFSGLEFYRLKQRGPELVQVEFSEQVYRDKTGRVVVESIE